VDIDLPLDKFQWADDGGLNIEARGRLHRKIVAIGIRLDAAWVPEELEESPITLYWGTGEIRNLGATSHQFVRALGELYGQNLTGKRMPDSVPVKAVGLNDDPRLLPDQPVKMKLFFEPENEEGYAEVYWNIDVGKQLVEIHEKDPEYRLNILRALSAST
jgi:hypothetical protein